MTSGRHADEKESAESIQPRSEAATRNNTVIMLSEPDEQSMVEVITPVASQENTPRAINNIAWELNAFSHLDALSHAPIIAASSTLERRSQGIYIMMQLSRVMLLWRNDVLVQRINCALPQIIVYMAKRHNQSRVRAAMYAWQRAAPNYI